jgi:hypothetical protein
VAGIVSGLPCGPHRYVYGAETAIPLGGGHSILDRLAPLVGCNLYRSWRRRIFWLLEIDEALWTNLICPYRLSLRSTCKNLPRQRGESYEAIFSNVTPCGTVSLGAAVIICGRVRLQLCRRTVQSVCEYADGICGPCDKDFTNRPENGHWRRLQSRLVSFEVERSYRGLTTKTAEVLSGYGTATVVTDSKRASDTSSMPIRRTRQRS